MLTLLNLNCPEPVEETTNLSKRDLLRTHYIKRRKQAHRVRLILETISTVLVSIETHILLFGLISIVWTLVDVTMLLADDID